MNSSQSQNSIVRSNGRRVVVTLALALFVFQALVPLAAQVRNTRHITSVWTATTAEGSRVHVVSDSPVSDYEGYTRGGRFYVKIPLADLPTARGSLLGRGFDDVQIQRYGDGIIISFHLLPGTAVRVDQAANQLEVVFTIPSGYSAVAGARESDESTRTRARRIADAAGPAPSGSTARYALSGSASSGRRSGNASESRQVAPKNRSERESAGGRRSESADKAPTKSAEKEAGSRTSGPAPMASPSPVASPTVTPSAQAGSATPVASPIVSPAYQAIASPTPNRAAAKGDNDWKSRVHYWSVWAELNWLPILIVSLAVLALLVVLFFWRAAKRARVETDVEDAHASDSVVAVKEKDIQAPATPPAGAAAVASKTEAPPVSSSHLSNAVPSRSESDQGEEQEREVFEL